MIELKNTTFDEEEDGIALVSPGTYPAHISGFARNEYNGSTVFNMTYRIAEETGKLTMNKVEKNGDGKVKVVTDTEGNPLKVSCQFMVGRDYRGQGIWLTPKPDKADRWKNRKYKEFAESLGIEFPEKKVNGKTMKVLGEIEEDDVLGLPCFISLVAHTFISNTTGDEVETMRVGTVFTWNDGKRVDRSEFDEEVPF